MDLIQSLKNIGLNEKQAQTYLSLLQLGKATAYEVAKHSQIKKSTTYVILDELVDKGFVAKLPRTKVLQYQALNPEDIFSSAQSRLQNAQEALPELKALARGKIRKVRVTYYEGLKGVKDVYAKQIKEMKGKEIVGFYAHEKDTAQELSVYWHEITAEYAKWKIKRKVITPYDKSVINFIANHPEIKKLTDTKMLPLDIYSSNISLEIYKNYTQIVSHRYLQAILIDNPDVANVLRQIFELVWERQDIVKQEIK